MLPKAQAVSTGPLCRRAGPHGHRPLKAGNFTTTSCRLSVDPSYDFAFRQIRSVSSRRGTAWRVSQNSWNVRHRGTNALTLSLSQRERALQNGSNWHPLPEGEGGG
jgi:hypothetical protein